MSTPATISQPDLDAYFARIGYAGVRDPSLETLGALMLHHTTTIPFENLDVLLGRRIRLETAALEEKLVRARRGGYCFEQNGLFLTILRALGFRVVTHIGRVRWMVPADVTLPPTHMVLRVEIDGRSWLADVGFGGVGLTGPIALDTTKSQRTPHGIHRVLRQNGRFVHQAKIGDAWNDIYAFAPDEVPAIDYEVANWYTSTHPESRFKQNIIVASATRDGGRRTLFNREFTTRDRDGHAEKRDLANQAELLAVLAEQFDLRFPEGTEFEAFNTAQSAQTTDD
jgi:N-hydroxyarylamine O-acetyltransferase